MVTVPPPSHPNDCAGTRHGLTVCATARPSPNCICSGGVLSGAARVGLLVAAAVIVSACGAPERRTAGFDRMDFGEEGMMDDGVVDNAVEQVRVPGRPRAAASGRGGQGRAALPDFVLPAARCANEAERQGPSRAIGQVTNGTLENPCRLPPQGPAMIAVNKHAFGTDETIALLQWAGQQVERQFPAAPPLVVGGIAKEAGGYFPPHKSHQNGRDVDISYPRVGRHAPRRFELTDAASLDTERLWTLLEAWLAARKLSFVFMDYDLQAVLYQDLLEVGYSEAQLEPIFQYPSGPAEPRGLIRHASGHADHFHVRFRCPEADKPQCVD